LNFEIELENIILRRVVIFEFLHSQGQSRQVFCRRAGYEVRHGPQPRRARRGIATAWRAEPPCEIVRPEDENRESNRAPRVVVRLRSTSIQVTPRREVMRECHAHRAAACDEDLGPLHNPRTLTIFSELSG
jgi:hypothetical protein